MASLGSGNHSPFDMHVAVLLPLSTNPDEQLKLTSVPGISPWLEILNVELLTVVDSDRSPHLAKGE